MNDFLEKEKHILTEFEKLKPDLKTWAEQVCHYSMFIISDPDNFDINRLQIPIKFRLKEDKSLLQKAFFGTDGMINASDKLLKITDKVGVRIVVLTEDDVKKVAELLIKNGNNIFDKPRISRELDKEFGSYKALHIEVSPKDSTFFGKEYTAKELKYISCEIQIRTLVQHAYSEVRHHSTYKKVHKIDGEVEVMLTEVFDYMKKCDEYFCNIYKKIEVADKHIEEFFTEIAKIYLSVHPSVSLTNSVKLNTTITESNHKLNNLILNLYNIDDFDTDDIKQVIQNNIEDIKILLDLIDKEQTFFKNEPIVIFLVFLVLTKPNSIKKKWKADDSILREIYHKLNKSYENE